MNGDIPKGSGEDSARLTVDLSPDAFLRVLCGNCFLRELLAVSVWANAGLAELELKYTNV